MSTPIPRTCCPTHADRCRFGRDHAWAGPFLLDEGRPVDGVVWSEPGDEKCAYCGGVCTAEREDTETLHEYGARMREKYSREYVVELLATLLPVSALDTKEPQS